MPSHNGLTKRHPEPAAGCTYPECGHSGVTRGPEHGEPCLCVRDGVEEAAPAEPSGPGWDVCQGNPSGPCPHRTRLGVLSCTFCLGRRCFGCCNGPEHVGGATLIAKGATGPVVWVLVELPDDGGRADLFVGAVRDQSAGGDARATWTGAWADSDAAMKDVHRAVDEARAAREARWDKESLGRAAAGILSAPETVEAPTQPEMEAWPPVVYVDDGPYVPEVCGCEESTAYRQLLDEVQTLERLSGEYQTDSRREFFARLRRALGWRAQQEGAIPEEHEQPNDARPFVVFGLAAGTSAEQVARSLAVPRYDDTPDVRRRRRAVSAVCLSWLAGMESDFGTSSEEEMDAGVADLFLALAEVLR